MNLMTPLLLAQLKLWIAEDTVWKFYKTKEWRIIRGKARKRDNNECQKHKRRGGQAAMDMVHHKQHVKDHPELALLLSNTESLCNACHNEEHPEKLAGYKKPKFTNEERW